VSSSRRVPFVTLLLIVANIAAAFLLLIDPNLAYQFGFRPDQPHVLNILTCLFLHANVLHLLGNMLFLAAVGAAVELATGSLRFVVVYFVSGIAGVLAHFVMTKGSQDPAPFIGASGAIAGCAGYYAIRYTSLRVPIAPHRAVSVLAVTLLWLALQIIGAFVQIGESAGVSYWSHLGGFVAGLLLSLAFRAPDLGQRELGHEVLDQMNDRGPSALVTAAEQHLARHPEDPKALWDLADALDKLHEPRKEGDVLLRLIGLTDGEQQAEALRRLAHLGQISRMPILKRLQLADKQKASSPMVAKALLRSVVEGPDDPQQPEAMLTLAALEMESDPDKARELLADLQKRYPMHAAVDNARKRGWLD
jgi:membrane associated rhomboid family serine protease